MANIPIWPGSSSFSPGDTPFGFYDADSSFQTEADKFAKFAAQRLGYPIVDIELQDINFYTCFEEAINEYGAQLYNFQIINNSINRFFASLYQYFLLIFFYLFLNLF